MKQAMRMSSAAVALALGLAAPAIAQDQAGDTSPAPPTIALPAPSSEDAVGPAQLKDFSINGTVTRRADTPQPAATQPATRPTTVEAAPPPAQPAASITRNVEARADRAAAQSSGNSVPSQTPNATAAGSSFGFTPSAPTESQTASFGGALAPATTPIVDTTSTEGNLFSHWPWLLALAAALGAALWYFRRQRPGYALAGAGGDASAFDFSPPPARPQPPKPASPRPAPAPRPELRQPVSGGVTTKLAPAQGIVSTRLRPWLEIEFDPQAAIIDAEKASIQFEIVIFNSGSAPARDVLVEAALFNAGTDQDQVLSNFFGRQLGQSDGTTIPPLQRMSFRSIVTLPRDQLRLFEVEGRTLFVPVVGFNVHYRFSNGAGQSSTSYIVGRNNAGEKMAPFRVEQGSKTYRGLATREHSLRVRN
jgi:hypothetical protein